MDLVTYDMKIFLNVCLFASKLTVTIDEYDLMRERAPPPAPHGCTQQNRLTGVLRT
jgi:hypothetical protein